MTGDVKSGAQGRAEITSPSILEKALCRARDALLDLQHGDGYWCFELEADCTIPAEYILMMHFRGEVDGELQSKICVYLRERQGEDGGWPLFYKGELDLSCTVKTYYALKIAGDDPEQPHMRRAREAILTRGGAARCNVFTRIALALFEQLPWRGVPFIPVEIMLLPKWFFFHLSKVSYWSRTVMVPLFILCTVKPKAVNSLKVGIRELFETPPEEEKRYFPIRSRLNYFFFGLDKMGRLIEPLIPPSMRRRAFKKAENWILERLNGDGGLGAIFPAMVNAVESLECIGYPRDHPDLVLAREALRKLLIIDETSAYCQPCVSPVWDTGLAVLALQEMGGLENGDSIEKALDWLAERQLLEEPGDWQEYRPNLKGGGWAFQFRNDYYPDLDDTAVVAFAMGQSGLKRFENCIARAVDWICGMQSKNGGFAAFDADNTHYYLNEIPFADHGALLDPPTSDVSARCVMLLAPLVKKHERYRPVMERCLQFLYREQEEDGSWFGRWGANYIYGTWSVLAGLEQAGIGRENPHVGKAVTWLLEQQQEDGGWGEGNDTYYKPSELKRKTWRSNSFHTSWAVLGLMAAGETGSESVKRGIQFLLSNQEADGLWEDIEFNAPGFPKVFYLKYHGYDKFFPLWALARYQKYLSSSLENQ